VRNTRTIVGSFRPTDDPVVAPLRCGPPVRVVDADRAILVSPASSGSATQRLEALRIANETRHLRSVLKRDLKAGRASVIPLLVNPPDWLATMKVLDALLATPGRGRVKANKMLKREGISPAKTVGNLSMRQRRALLLALGVRVRERSDVA
jgi:hypothetical protein